MAVIVHCDVRLPDEPYRVIGLRLENRAGAVGVVVAVVPELGGHVGFVVVILQEGDVLHYRAGGCGEVRAGVVGLSDIDVRSGVYWGDDPGVGCIVV